MKNFINRISLISSTIIAVVCIYTLVFLISQSSGLMGKISDFPECYVPAKMIVDGNGSNGYVIAQLAEEQPKVFSGMGNRVVPLFVPPQGLALISPIGTLKVTMAIITWKAFLAGCLIIAVLFLKKIFSLQYKQTCYLIAGICLSHPCYEALRLDQLTTILLLSFSATIYFLRKNKDIPAGLFLSLMMMLKPQYSLPFLAYLAGLRRWRPLAVLASMFVLFTFIAFGEIGIAGFQNYFALMRSPESIMCMQPELHPTLRGQLLRLLPMNADIIFAVSAVIFVIVLAFSYLYGTQTREKSDAILRGVLCIIPIGLVTSLYCHEYDLLLLVPSLLVIFTDCILPFSSLFKLILIFAGIPFMLPVAINLHYGYLLHGGKINVLFLELVALALAIIYRMFHINQKNDTKAIPK